MCIFLVAKNPEKFLVDKPQKSKFEEEACLFFLFHVEY